MNLGMETSRPMMEYAERIAALEERTRYRRQVDSEI